MKVGGKKKESFYIIGYLMELIIQILAIGKKKFL
jgi:hypothetical protein